MTWMRLRRRSSSSAAPGTVSTSMSRSAAACRTAVRVRGHDVVVAGDLDEHGQDEATAHDELLDVEHGDGMLVEGREQAPGDAGPVVARQRDQQGALLVVHDGPTLVRRRRGAPPRVAPWLTSCGSPGRACAGARRCCSPTSTSSSAEGERWIVMGPNGAGKTTLLLLASGADVPDVGRRRAARRGDGRRRPRRPEAAHRLGEQRHGRRPAAGGVRGGRRHDGCLGGVGTVARAVRRGRSRACRRGSSTTGASRTWPAARSARCPRGSASGR